jgi:hypothetical protein
MVGYSLETKVYLNNIQECSPYTKMSMRAGAV